MKYICTKSDIGLEEVFTFNETINHDAFAEAVRRIKNHTHGNWRRVTRTPISAGFVNSKGECHGRSESLNLDSRPEKDTKLLRMQLSP